MEGVAFALKDCVETAQNNGSVIKETNLCGGGARSRIWRQITADILGIPVNILATEQGPGYGAAILAMIGCGEYSTAEEAVEQIVAVSETVRPDSGTSEYYRSKYAVFRALYPLLKQVY